MISFAIWLILLHYGITLISGKLVAMHGLHVQERRLADANYKRGYINIDCGNDEPDSSISGITYMPDSGFIDTGINYKISPDYTLYESGYIYNTVRSFPHGIRNCYTLKTLNGKGYKYLIRALFMYGNYDGKNTIPIFDLYIGVNFWLRLYVDTITKKTFSEIIHQPTTDFINICLVNIGRGTPFISALLLRPLNNSIYESDLGSLAISSRYNTGLFGADVTYTSYQDDIYDRLWGSLPRDKFPLWQSNGTTTELTSITNDAYKVPPSIFKVEARPIPGERSLSFFNPPSDSQAVSYVYWHFAETQKLGDHDLREFEIFLNGKLLGRPIRPKFLQALTIASPAITLAPGESQIHFSINQTNASTLPPILNAVEIYYAIELPQSATKEDDINAIMNIKTVYGRMNDWQGDPCLPVSPWDGLNCSDNNSNLPRIISLNLASRGLTGELLPSICSLTSLNYLNLSNNNLAGTIPEFLANMPSLQVIDLRGNNLSGSVPVKLTDKVKNGLLSLSLDDNPYLCSSDACTTSAKKRKKHKILFPLATSASLFVLLIAFSAYCAYRWKRKQGFINGNKSNGGMNSKNKHFTYSEVINMTNNFQTILGKGAFGTVYHGLLEDGSVVAVKILNQSSSLCLESFQTEVELLMRIHHKNLVSLVGYCDEGITMALIYDYMANGNLQEQLLEGNTKSLSWKERLQISIDAAQGLEYLHSGCKPAIVHRDLKTANILLDNKLQAKIADFGLSRVFASESATSITTQHMVGTPGYLDPEFQVSYRLNEKSDVYSFGVILLELITGQMAMIKKDRDAVHIVNWVTPFLDRGEIHQIVDKTLQGDYDTNSAWKALETAMACVPLSSYQRPSMGQVLIDLKECLALELGSDKAIKGFEPEPNSSSQIFDGICIDSEVNMGPSVR